MLKKKKSKNSKEEKEEEIQDKSELEEELDEEMLKETAEKTFSEDSIRKNIDDNQFREFLRPSTKSTVPVLEKIAEPRESTDLEQNIFTMSTDTEAKKDEGNYVPIEQKYSSGREEEIKIEDANLLIRPFAPMKVDAARANLHPEVGQTFQINPELQTIRQTGAGNPEEELYIKAGRLEENNALPFERERKYKGRTI